MFFFVWIFCFVCIFDIRKNVYICSNLGLFCVNKDYYYNILKGERNQLMIWGFTEFRTNNKNESMTFSMKILQGLVLKHVYILLILNFPLNMEAAISHLSVT